MKNISLQINSVSLFEGLTSQVYKEIDVIYVDFVTVKSFTLNETGFRMST